MSENGEPVGAGGGLVLLDRVKAFHPITDDATFRQVAELRVVAAEGVAQVEASQRPGIKAAADLHKRLLAEAKVLRAPWDAVVEACDALLTPYREVQAKAAAQLRAEVDAAARIERDRALAAADAALAEGHTGAVAEAVQQVNAIDRAAQVAVYRLDATPAVAGLGFFTRRDIEVFDDEQVPQCYWRLDLVRVRADALAGVDIPGVRVVSVTRAKGGRP